MLNDETNRPTHGAQTYSVTYYQANSTNYDPSRAAFVLDWMPSAEILPARHDAPTRALAGPNVATRAAPMRLHAVPLRYSQRRPSRVPCPAAWLVFEHQRHCDAVSERYLRLVVEKERTIVHR